MKESEYIAVGDLIRVRAAMEALHGVYASSDPMDKLPYVFEALQKIEAHLTAKIRVRP